MSLREQLAEERQVLLSREAEKAVLETRIVRLTHIVLNSTRAMLASQPAASHAPHSPPQDTSTSDILTRATASTTHAAPSLGSVKEYSEPGMRNDHDKALASVRRERSTTSLVRCCMCHVPHPHGMGLSQTTSCAALVHQALFHSYALLSCVVVSFCTLNLEISSCRWYQSQACLRTSTCFRAPHDTKSRHSQRLNTVV